MIETNIFELLHEQYHLPNKPKLFEAFAQLYKQAGNGIVIDVFAAIIKNLI